MEVDWSDIHKDIVDSILKQIEHLSDYIRLGSICKSWQSSMVDIPRPLHLGFPFLLLSRRTTTTGNNRRDYALYSPFERKVHPVKLPDRPPSPVRCIGSSSNGWVCMIDDSLRIYMFNPFSNALVLLPPLSRTNLNLISDPKPSSHGSLEFAVKDEFIEGYQVMMFGEGMRDHYIYKAVWSAEPTDPLNCAIFLCLRISTSMYYCRPGDARWTMIKTQLDYVSDAIFYKDNLYLVDNDTEIATIDLLHQGGGQGITVPKLEVKAYETKLDVDLFGLRTRKYLVAGPSGLLFILRHYKYSFRCVYERRHLTFEFRVFKLDEMGTQWVETKSLDDGVLFLGMNSSIWVSSRNFKECKGNSIYFTDDDRFDSVYEDGRGGDSGVFHMEDRSFTSLCDNDLKNLYPYPLWVLPNP
ncbi:hypothetical protein QJS04_geneDACA002821 [Acorus gramineus]|uniref:KIB1-4 beta-propeller domain-containing protein n=1 Tax=Acorus gramineus TaxID=55184 RepID=A0AAV9BU62_ACOGR|nr:hypothetical protein QJS04_geneDACA002821 [Acorus gramineus]